MGCGWDQVTHRTNFQWFCIYTHRTVYRTRRHTQNSNLMFTITWFPVFCPGICALYPRCFIYLIKIECSVRKFSENGQRFYELFIVVVHSMRGEEKLKVCINIHPSNRPKNPKNNRHFSLTLTNGARINIIQRSQLVKHSKFRASQAPCGGALKN